MAWEDYEGVSEAELLARRADLDRMLGGRWHERVVTDDHGHIRYRHGRPVTEPAPPGGTHRDNLLAWRSAIDAELRKRRSGAGSRPGLRLVAQDERAPAPSTSVPRPATRPPPEARRHRIPSVVAAGAMVAALVAVTAAALGLLLHDATAPAPVVSAGATIAIIVQAGYGGTVLARPPDTYWWRLVADLAPALPTGWAVAVAIEHANPWIAALGIGTLTAWLTVLILRSAPAA